MKSKGYIPKNSVEEKFFEFIENSGFSTRDWQDIQKERVIQIDSW